MPGGVGGRREQSRLLPDFLKSGEALQGLPAGPAQYTTHTATDQEWFKQSSHPSPFPIT